MWSLTDTLTPHTTLPSRSSLTPSLTRTHKYLLATLFTLAVLDVSITYYALYHLTGYFEHNQLAVSLMNTHGPIALLAPYPLGITTCLILSRIHPWQDTARTTLLTLYTLYAAYTVTTNYLLVF